MNPIVRRLREIRVGLSHRGRWPPERLGLLERWYAAQPEPRVTACVLEFDAPLETAALTHALARLRERHAWALDATLHHGRSGLSLERRPSEALPLATEVRGVWSCAERELLAPFALRGLLWRARLSEDRRALVLVFHHAIADGMSVSIFARELLAWLGGAPPSDCAEPRLPLDARLDLRPSIRVFARELAADMRRAPPSYFRGPAEELGARRTRLHPFELPAGLVRSLAGRARCEGTTLHAALCAAGLFASAAAAGFPLTARLLSPISLRSRALPAPQGFGVFLCAHEADVRLDRGAQFWQVASGYGRVLGAALPAAYLRLGMLRFAGDLAALAARITRDHANARTSTLEVSNLGRVGGLGSARVWFVQGNHYHGPLFNLTAATCSESGVLRAALCVADPVVSDAAASSFVRHVLCTLERAAGTTNPACAEAESREARSVGE